MGYGHSIENIRSTDSKKMIIVFNGGLYEEIGLSSWLASNPEQLVADNLNPPLETIRKFSMVQKFIVK